MSEGQQSGGSAAVVNEIAAWCEDRAKELGTEASRQFRLIVVIVVIGLILLLVLPPLIGQIDFLTTRLFGGAPPMQSLENAEGAVRRLGDQVAESQARFEDLDGELSSIREGLQNHADRRNRLLGQADSLMSAPLALWQPQEPAGPFGRWADVMVAPDGSLLTAGLEGDSTNAEILILRSDDGQSWSSLRPIETSGARLKGWVNAFATASDNTLLAAGFEGAINSPKVLILRSGNGLNWLPIRPLNTEGERLQGWLSSFAVATDNTLFAAGSENRILEETVDEFHLILRSENGENWSAIHPKDDQGERLRGRLNSLTATTDGLLLATGYEGDFRKAEVVILSSVDGQTWSAVRPTTTQGERLRGDLSALLFAPDGSRIAVGTEVGTGRPQDGTGAEASGAYTLILRSVNGQSWLPIRPQNPEGGRLKGGLTGIFATPSGALLAAGYEGDFGDPRFLLLRSEDGLSWSPIRAENVAGERLAGWITALEVGPDGYLFGAGSQVWRSSVTGEANEALRNLPRDGSWQENPERVTQALNGLLSIISQHGSGYPEGTAKLRDSARETISAWDRDRESEARVVTLHSDAVVALKQQEDTLMNVQEGTELLARALTDADELRRASRIATRIAVVALLIYLVQIVVNRYRYLQRMEGFYRARAQALRLMAAAPQAEAALKDITITDLMLALSPDGIGFDKSADPPTQNMMNIFREALRREKTP